MPVFSDDNIERLFGAEDAENEDERRFREYFYSNKTYENIRSELPIRILVGHKGIGKSALLKRAYLDDIDTHTLCVWIQPNDLVDLSIQDGTFIQMIEAWKNGVLRVIASKILDEVTGGNETYQPDRAWSAHASNLVSFLAKQIQSAVSSKVAVVDKHIVDQFKLKGVIHVYIDDIDRGWSARERDIRNISALLNAIRDITGSDRRIKFRVGLRTDVYFLVRTSDESTDKIERNVIWLRWTNHEVLSIIAKRIETFFGAPTTQKEIERLSQRAIADTILSKVIEPVFEGRGHWGRRSIHHVLLSLTRQRPRDLVKLLSGAARRAYMNNHQIISSRDLEASFVSYSEERLQDTINEFKSEMPQIDKLLLEMRPTKKQRRTAESYVFSTDQLSRKLSEIRRHVNIQFTNRRHVSGRSLIQFLYKIDFITARRDSDGLIDRRYFDEG